MIGACACGVSFGVQLLTRLNTWEYNMHRGCHVLYEIPLDPNQTFFYLKKKKTPASHIYTYIIMFNPVLYWVYLCPVQIDIPVHNQRLHRRKTNTFY